MAQHGKITINPPIILAIETSGMCGSIALVCPGQCVAEYSLQTKMTHSRRLLSCIDRLLDDAALTWEDLDGLAVSLGPGSFTGLRIGLSTIKGLAMASTLPLIGISTLDGLASQLSSHPMLIAPVIDARKKEIYTALYRGSLNGTLQRISDEMAISPQDFASRINESVLLIGDGTSIYGDFFKENLGALAIILPNEVYYPRASTIGMLAVPLWEKKQFLDPASAVPVYIRPSEAEIHFK